MAGTDGLTRNEGNRILQFNVDQEISHGIAVSNLAGKLAREAGLSEEKSHELAVAGMVHDIGKLKLHTYIENQKKDPLVIEELKYVRMHSMLGYEILKGQGDYSDFILESVLYHHENFDGSGYPFNLSGEKIPIGARILRICDVFCALTSDRPYRKAFDLKTALELMIEDNRHFDLRIFLAFQRVVHNGYAPCPYKKADPDHKSE